MNLWSTLQFVVFLNYGCCCCKAFMSKLKVHIPKSLSRNGTGYDHVEAMFGSPPYGGSITAPVYYADSDYCDPHDTCLTEPPFEYYPFHPFVHRTNDPAVILMINRGNCSFSQQVRNAQYNGAAGVLIADTMCLCEDSDSREREHVGSTCESKAPTMLEYGSSFDVRIPSFLVFKGDADLFKSYMMHNNRTMRVEMSFPQPSTLSKSHSIVNSSRVNNDNDEKEARSRLVKIEHWMTPWDKSSISFLSNFHPILTAMASCIDFAPHMYIIDGSRMGCRRWNDTGSDQNQTNHPCQNLCTNEGRYCAADPGASYAVAESLRQICILSQHNNNTYHSTKQEEGSISSNTLQWWAYIEALYSNCSLDEVSMLEHGCIDLALSLAGIDKNQIDSCMLDSGGLYTDAINVKLQNEIDSESIEHVLGTPTLLVGFRNTVRRQSSLSTNALFGKICSLCGQKQMPDLCEACSSCSDASACVARGGHCPPRPIAGWYPSASSAHATNDAPIPKAPNDEDTVNGGLSIVAFIFSLILLVVATVTISMWYSKRRRTETRQQVRAVMEEYLPVENDASW